MSLQKCHKNVTKMNEKENEKDMRNNKGFSLVELIIVIAIMAILVGVMAPQLIKYIEKTNVSSDTQLCDTVKSAVTTAVMDPTVLNDSASATKISGFSTWTSVKSLTGTTEVEKAIQDTLGMTSTTIGSIDNQLKSWNGGTKEVKFMVVSSNSVHVYIPGSDSTGKKSSNQAPIYVD